MQGTDAALSFCARLAQQLITSNTADSGGLPCALPTDAAELVSGQSIMFVEGNGDSTILLTCGQTLQHCSLCSRQPAPDPVSAAESSG